MKFNYKAKNQKGVEIEGVIEAMSKSAAVTLLQKDSLTPYFVEEVKNKSDLFRGFKKLWEGVSVKEQVIFFRSFAIMIDAKVPVVAALKSVEEQTQNVFFKSVIKDLRDDIEDGASFSEALSRYPDIFEEITIGLVHAGEVSGNFQKAILYVANSIEKNYQLASKIKGAFIYPAFVVSAALIIGFIVMTTVLPKLTQIIKDLNVTDLPWYTTAIMGLGDFMQNYWWAIVIVFLGGIFSAVYYVKTPSGRTEWDRVKVNIPLFGQMFRKIYMMRFGENLAMLIEGGIPVVRALTTTADVVNNVLYKEIILRAATSVKTGGSMSEVFERTEYFPSIVTQMVKVGEETGKVTDVLRSITAFYEEEVDRFTRTLTALLEPILIVILGLGVAVLVFAILLPIYDVIGKI